MTLLPRFLPALIILLALCLPMGRAWALSPYSHLILAQEVFQQGGEDLPRSPAVREALLAGSLAPDAGYYTKKYGNLATLVHLVKPWQMCRALMDLAQTPEERAFAVGWVSHALLDLRGHGRLVNRITGVPYAKDRLGHKRAEWGLAAWLLARRENAWLWRVKYDPAVGLALWQRALRSTYGIWVPKTVLLHCQKAQLKEVARLPKVFWLSGQLDKPQGFWGNLLGAVLKWTARPLGSWYFSWRGDLDAQAVLSVRPPDKLDQSQWGRVMSASRAQLTFVLRTRSTPPGTLDADPDCERAACPLARAALKWMERYKK